MLGLEPAAFQASDQVSDTTYRQVPNYRYISLSVDVLMCKTLTPVLQRDATTEGWLMEDLICCHATKYGEFLQNVPKCDG